MSQPQRPPILAMIGFAATGLFSFGLVCILVLMRPAGLVEGPAAGLLVAIPHLTTLGWISSLLFAATYLVSPLLAGNSLWSNRLPSVHLVCHLSGLGLLIGGLSVANYPLASAGAGLLLLGFILLITNVFQTGSQRSLWTPANLAFHSAMFWLIITGASALVMLYGRSGGELPTDAQTLLALHVQYGLFGFLAQVLLAVSLRLVPEMLQSDGPSGRGDTLGWTGWALLNGGLLLLLPLADSGRPWLWPLFAVGALMAMGIAAFAVQIAQELAAGWRRIGWPELTHATGILLLVIIVAAALASYPTAAAAGAEELHAWMRIYISLILLGPFAFAILGVGQRMLPRLVWQLRLAPWAGHGRLPTAQSLGRASAGGPIYISLVLAWSYLAFAQWMGDTEAARLAALLMLVAGFWLVVAIKPAVHRFVLGVTPLDLGEEATMAKSDEATAGVHSARSSPRRSVADTEPRTLNPQSLTVRQS